MPKNLGRDLRWCEGSTPPNLSEWRCHLQTMYINSNGVVCWGASFELSIVSLSIQNLNYLKIFSYCINRKVGGWCLRTKTNTCVLVVFVRVVPFVGEKIRSCITYFASADVLPTKSLLLSLGWLAKWSF